MEQSSLRFVVLGMVQVLPATDVSTQFRNHNPVNNVSWALTRDQVLSDMKVSFAKLFVLTIILRQKPCIICSSSKRLWGSLPIAYTGYSQYVFIKLSCKHKSVICYEAITQSFS